MKDWSSIPGAQYPMFSDKERTKHRWRKETIYRDKYHYYHKDPLHGEVEVYDLVGNHCAVMTPEGERHPKKGRDPRKNIRNIL